jgi:hypothetical protein
MKERTTMLAYRVFALSAVLAGGLATGVLAQDSPRSTQPPPLPPVLPSPQNNATIPEKIHPQEPSTTGSTGETLSDKLKESDGIIRPPAGIAPDMTVPAPVPNPGTTPVIPPSPRIDPK